MKKKIYNQPSMSIMEMHVDNVMLTVSVNGGGGGGQAGAPGRKGDIIP